MFARDDSTKICLDSPLYSCKDVHCRVHRASYFEVCPVAGRGRRLPVKSPADCADARCLSEVPVPPFRVLSGDVWTGACSRMGKTSCPSVKATTLSFQRPTRRYRVNGEARERAD